MDKLEYKLDVFEGPLDLLLYLISKNKLNINDIQLTVLIDQYVEHIRQMQLQDMDIASEFLEMASRLIYLKTVSLLPKHEEAEQMKEELTVPSNYAKPKFFHIIRQRWILTDGLLNNLHRSLLQTFTNYKILQVVHLSTPHKSFLLFF